MKTATNNSSSSSNGVMTRWAWHKKLPEGQTPNRRSHEADQKELLKKHRQTQQKMPKGQTPTGRKHGTLLEVMAAVPEVFMIDEKIDHEDGY